MTDESDERLPEERQFRAVWVGWVVVASVFLWAFIMETAIKARVTPRDITANWFAAWGQWAGGLATAAAFFIAALSIRVTGAHARRDRQVAAEVRDDKDMVQARQLVIFKVNMPEPYSFEGIAFFRVENRSNERFFDIRVPFADVPGGLADHSGHRTPELVAAENLIYEYLPTGESLLPYMQATEEEGWFTQVNLHTSNWAEVKFAVEYTDARGLRWRQHYGGKIERILTHEAIPVRDADRFQALPKIRTITDDEKRRLGGRFASDLPPLDDDATLEFLGGPAYLANWKRVERVGQPRATDNRGPAGGLQIEFSYPSPGAGQPMWETHLWDELKNCGFTQQGGSSVGSIMAKTMQCTEANLRGVVAAFDEAIANANDRFEANELAAAQRAHAAAEASAEQAADRQAYLDELTREFAKPGQADWQMRNDPDDETFGLDDF
jgi:hypothetical protein